MTTPSPPPLPTSPERKSSGARQLVAGTLSLCLALFLADAVVSLIDDSLILLFDVHLLSGLRALVFLLSFILAVAAYALMGLTMAVPKRFFLPLVLFVMAAQLVVLPILIYLHGRLQMAAWFLSLAQVIVGTILIKWVSGSFRLRWPLISENQLNPRSFSWTNLLLFVLANVFVLFPGILAYIVLCSALAVDHFSDGFIALRPSGLTVEVRKYAHADGKTVILVPMSHVGEPEFYREISKSFPTNSVLLVEGVSDDLNLLTNKVTYRRMAQNLGLAEQQREFKPSARTMVRADVDVSQFGTNTINLLNLAMLFHAHGLTPENLVTMMQFSPPAGFEERMLDDVLNKRNRRGGEEIHNRRSESEMIIVPWGAAHMPGIARELLKSGYRLQERRELVAIRFGGKNGASKELNRRTEKPK